MSEIEKVEEIENLLDAYTASNDKSNRTEVLEKINKELEVFLSTETNEEDKADGILNLLRDLSDSVQEEFEELVFGGRDKKTLHKGLVKNLHPAPKHKSSHDWKN